MSDIPPPTNVFEKMRTAAKDPWYTAVIYEAHLEHVDPEEPLWLVPYFGQSVRQGTAIAIFEARKDQHVTKAARDDKELGFHAVIDMFGTSKVEWRIVSSKTGPRSEMQAWANAEEVKLIAEHGGILQDMDAKLTQTLNWTKGGKGDPRAVWEAIDARRRRALTKFKRAMETYVEEHDSALVPTAFIDADGYPLGVRLNQFRQGGMRKGLPEEADIDAWAEDLPKWEWNLRDVKRRNALTKFQQAMETYVEEHDSALVPTAFVDADGYRLGERLHSFRQGQMRKGLPDEAAINAWAEDLPKWEWDARESDELKAKNVQNGKNQWSNQTSEKRTTRIDKQKATMATDASKAKRSETATRQAANETPEQKTARLGKTKATMATDKSKAKRSKITTKQLASERCAELERARPIAVPFEKSKKRRTEMRAESKHTKPSGRRGENVLYMVSEDKLTIRRVTKDGMMQTRTIVGPVVDPPAAEAGPSDLNAYVSDDVDDSDLEMD